MRFQKAGMTPEQPDFIRQIGMVFSGFQRYLYAEAKPSYSVSTAVRLMTAKIHTVESIWPQLPDLEAIFTATVSSQLAGGSASGEKQHH